MQTKQAWFAPALLVRDPANTGSAPTTSKPHKNHRLETDGFYVVGVTGLEPATSRPPAVRATRLRYTPTSVLFYTSLVISGAYGHLR